MFYRIALGAATALCLTASGATAQSANSIVIESIGGGCLMFTPEPTTSSAVQQGLNVAIHRECNGMFSQQWSYASGSVGNFVPDWNTDVFLEVDTAAVMGGNPDILNVVVTDTYTGAPTQIWRDEGALLYARDDTGRDWCLTVDENAVHSVEQAYNVVVTPCNNAANQQWRPLR